MQRKVNSRYTSELKKTVDKYWSRIIKVQSFNEINKV